MLCGFLIPLAFAASDMQGKLSPVSTHTTGTPCLQFALRVDRTLSRYSGSSHLARANCDAC